MLFCFVLSADINIGELETTQPKVYNPVLECCSVVNQEYLVPPCSEAEQSEVVPGVGPQGVWPPPPPTLGP